MSGEKQIEERNELVELLEDIGHDWDAYIDECQENEERPQLSYEDFYADSILEAGYRKQSENTVEVIRCKDCEHWYSPNNDDAHYCHLTHGLRGLVAEEDYCSYAKMKGGAE